MDSLLCLAWNTIIFCSNINSIRWCTDVAVSGDSEVGTDKNASLYTTAHLSSSVVMSTGNEDIPRLEVEHTEVPLPELPDLVDKVCPPTTPEKLFVHSS
jgi:hypothetical protein